MTDAAPVSPPDIGSVLKEARLRRGQTLDVVHQHTRIPKKLLEALETNRFDDFPAPVYLRGFLKGYCDHLDVDFEPLWSKIAPPKPAEVKKDEEPQKEAPRPLPVQQPNLLPWVVVGGFLAVGGLFFALKEDGPSAPKVQPPAPKPPAAIAPIQKTEKMKLKVVFKGDAWVRLHADGQLRFEGRAPAGFTQEWAAMDSFTIRTSESQNVGLTLDGKDYPLDPSKKNAAGDYQISRP